MTEPRIPALPPQDWPPTMKDALAAIIPPEVRHPRPKREGRPKGLNVLGTLAHHPELTRAYHTFNGHVQLATSLTPRQRELLILRVASVRDCAYEWAQHVVLAADAGLSEDEIARIADGPGAGWSPLEDAMLAAVDQLVAGARIADDTWAALAEALDVPQLMDLVFTVGSYETLARALLSFGVELDDDLTNPRST